MHISHPLEKAGGPVVYGRWIPDQVRNDYKEVQNDVLGNPNLFETRMQSILFFFFEENLCGDTAVI